ncbi:MAG: PDZ domain-containing protein, partial [Eggerthellaceae bacterium]|nr:PDZ domain-containing protein [Eggerthellaceae bacterium]
MKQHSNEYLRRFGKKRNRLVRFMVGLFLVCIAFAAGFIVRGNEAFLTRLGFETAANSIDANPGMTVQGDTRNSLSARISEVEGVLEQRSMDDFDLDVATTDILNIISDITDDPYVSYLDQSHYETYLSSASNSYQGIGVLFSEVDGKAYAVDVFGGSDAEANDVRAGDFVVAIDGDRGTGGWTQAEVVRELNQKADGETTVITWRRPASLFDEGGNEYTVELKVSQYEEPNVTVELVDGEVGYIKLSQITSNSTELVEEAVKNLQEAGATCYVLD